MKKIILILSLFVVNVCLAQTIAIPVAGTNSLNPVSGTIVVKTVVNGFTILVDTVNGNYYIGAGNRKDLGTNATIYSRINFGKLGTMILENNDGSVRNAISLNDPSLNLTSNDGTTNTLFQQGANSMVFYGSSSAFPGAQYSSHYWNNYDDYSIPDVGYVKHYADSVNIDSSRVPLAGTYPNHELTGPIKWLNPNYTIPMIYDTSGNGVMIGSSSTYDKIVSQTQGAIIQLMGGTFGSFTNFYNRNPSSLGTPADILFSSSTTTIEYDTSTYAGVQYIPSTCDNVNRNADSATMPHLGFIKRLLRDSGGIPYVGAISNVNLNSKTMSNISNLSIGTNSTSISPLFVTTSIPALGTYITDLDPSVVVARSFDTSGITNGHGYVDANIFKRHNGSLAYNSFTDNSQYAGKSNYNHHSSFQSAFNYLSTGTLDNLWGFKTNEIVSSGTITARAGVQINDITGGGTVHHNYAFYANGMTKGDIDNWAFYAPSNRSYFGGGAEFIGGTAVKATISIGSQTTYTGNVEGSIWDDNLTNHLYAIVNNHKVRLDNDTTASGGGITSVSFLDTMGITGGVNNPTTNPSVYVSGIDLGGGSLTGTLSPTHGGTGFSSYTIGGILYANSTSTLAKLNPLPTSVGSFLMFQGSAAPVVSTIHIVNTIATGQMLCGIGTNSIGIAPSLTYSASTLTTPTLAISGGSSSNILSGSGTSISVGTGLSLSGGTLTSSGGGTILGALPATSGLIGFSNGTANTLTTSPVFTYSNNVLGQTPSLIVSGNNTDIRSVFIKPSYNDASFTNVSHHAIQIGDSSRTYGWGIGLSMHITGANATNRHIIDDYSTITPIVADSGFGVFDVSTTMNGSVQNNHFIAYQARQKYSSTKPLNGTYGLAGLLVLTNQSGGLVTNNQGIIIDLSTGSGSSTNKYGLHILPVSGGTTSNYAIYSEGGNSQFNGDMTLQNGHAFYAQNGGSTLGIYNDGVNMQFTSIGNAGSLKPLLFNTYNTSTGYNNLMTIFANSGNMLIQTGGTYTDAGYKLDVQGNSRVTGTLTVASESVTGNSVITGSLSIGTYEAFKGITVSATLDFPSTAGSTTSTLTVTATGAAVGDPVSLGAGNTQLSKSLYTAQVTATNTVTVTFVNIDPVNPQDPASGTFKIKVLK